MIFRGKNPKKGTAYPVEELLPSQAYLDFKAVVATFPDDEDVFNGGSGFLVVVVV